MSDGTLGARSRLLMRRTPQLGGAEPAAPPRAGKRVLIASHGHPAITRGGAEIAAYALYEEFRRTLGWEAWFLGCRPEAGSERLGATITQPYDEHEFVYGVGPFDWLKFANRDPNFPREFRALLRELRPDVVHFHHFINFGVEAFAIVREVLPNARIVLTLHEYLAICHHYGQMVKKQRETLCYRSSLEDCHRCFPDIAQSEFFLRSLYIRRFFTQVDLFISPSEFLAERFRAWGLRADQIRTIENVIAAPVPAASGEQTEPGPLRVGFFGQISRLKGIAVLFDAAAELAADETAVVFDIYGEYRGQPLEFQEEFLSRLASAGPNIRYHGRYEPERVDMFMRGIDVTIVPSIWWENSPVVIQEAFRNQRPVVCSDIGGMAEKVRNGVDGWHFSVGSALSLAALLRRLEADRAIISTVKQAMSSAPQKSEVLALHLQAYERPAAEKNY